VVQIGKVDPKNLSETSASPVLRGKEKQPLYMTALKIVIVEKQGSVRLVAFPWQGEGRDGGQKNPL
jgi:hypothetical protein